MFKWRGNKSNGNNPVKQQEVAAPEMTAELMRNFIERMISDARQMAEEIKTKARTEAEKEASEIIRNSQTPGSKAQITENIPPAEIAFADSVPEKTVAEEAGSTSSDSMLTDEQPEQEQPAIPESAQGQPEMNAEMPEAPSPAAENEESASADSTIPETSDDMAQEHPEAEVTAGTEEKPSDPGSEAPVMEQEKTAGVRPEPEKEIESLPMDSTAIFNGDVELSVGVPVDPVAVARLYNKLQSTPDMKILYTSGSWDKGTVITVSLEKPLPLLGIISNIPGVNARRTSGKEENGKKPNSLLTSSKAPAGRINLILKSM